VGGGIILQEMRTQMDDGPLSGAAVAGESGQRIGGEHHLQGQSHLASFKERSV